MVRRANPFEMEDAGAENALARHHNPTATPDSLCAQHSTVRVRIDLAYDGTFFSGWATQPGRVTVQGVLEQALELVLRSRHRVTVAGRTDAGVHAQAQTVHLDIAARLWERLRGRDGAADPAETLHRKLTGALRRTLADAQESLGLVGQLRGGIAGAVVITAVAQVPHDFDARFSATGRRYVYRISDNSPSGANPLHRTFTWAIPQRLEVDLLNEAAAEMVGLHDFLSFCKPRKGATTVRHLKELHCERTETGVIQVHVAADAFCHHMVRSLVGALVLYGTGARTRTWLRALLEAPARDASLTLAPPQGLALAGVDYPPPEYYGRQAEKTRRRREP